MDSDLSEEIHRILHLKTFANVDCESTNEIKNLSPLEFRRNYTKKNNGISTSKAYKYLTGKTYLPPIFYLMRFIYRIIAFPFKLIFRFIKFLFTPKFYKHWISKVVIPAIILGVFSDILICRYGKGEGLCIVKYLIEDLQSLF